MESAMTDETTEAAPAEDDKPRATLQIDDSMIGQQAALIGSPPLLRPDPTPVTDEAAPEVQE